jgi:hypothetical protein
MLIPTHHSHLHRFWQGHQMEHAHDESFSSCGSEDCFSKKGFWGVKMVKGTQPYWIIATHAQAYEGIVFSSMPPPPLHP